MLRSTCFISSTSCNLRFSAPEGIVYGLTTTTALPAVPRMPLGYGIVQSVLEEDICDLSQRMCGKTTDYSHERD